MQTLQTGQKLPLSALMSPGTPNPPGPLTLSARVTGPAAEYDLMVFGLDEAGRLSDDRYLVFYNQPRSPEGALSMSSGTRGEKVFTLDLARLPTTLRRLSLAATVENGAFGQIDHAEITLSAGGVPLASYRVTGRDFQHQRAVMLLDVYHRGEWRLGAVGQGFNGGLDALVRHFGGEVADSPLSRPPAPPPPVAPPPVVPPPAPSAPTPAPSVQRVTLDKQGASARLSLSKAGSPDPVRVNLNWDRGGAGVRGASDLDLGCMYFLNDGDRGVIQALGNHFGSERLSPHIELDKDDRTGAAQDGENLTIYRPDLIHTVLIFAFIYEGTSDFTRVNGRLTLRDPRGNEITVRLSNPDLRRTFCAIASIENFGGEIRITKEERYFHGHQDCDEHYGFGFRWSAGSK